MRIAQVAPLYESVPPTAYGGTERVVSPGWLEWVRIRGLRIGEAEVDLRLNRNRSRDVGIHVERRSGPAEVRVVG
jgi:hypothetical protein